MELSILNNLLLPLRNKTYFLISCHTGKPELPKKKKNEAPWETAGKILKGKKSPQKSIVLGIFLMLTGAPIWEAGQLTNSGATTLTGLLLFFGGVIAFLVGIADYLGLEI